MYNDKALEVMLNEVIDRRIKSILKDKGFETPYEGRVESIEDVDGNIDTDGTAITDPYAQYAQVFIAGYDVVVRLRNLSGELLATRNRVRVYTNNSNLANGYIGIKCN